MFYLFANEPRLKSLIWEACHGNTKFKYDTTPDLESLDSTSVSNRYYAAEKVCGIWFASISEVRVLERNETIVETEVTWRKKYLTYMIELLFLVTIRESHAREGNSERANVFDNTRCSCVWICMLMMWLHFEHAMLLWGWHRSEPFVTSGAERQQYPRLLLISTNIVLMKLRIT